MEIINVGYNYRHPAGFCIDRPHGSGDYILLIIKSEAYVFLNGERVDVSPNSAIIFDKGSPQLYGSKSGEYVNDWMHFDMDENETEFLSLLGVAFNTVIPLYESGEPSSFIKSIFLELYSQNYHKEATIKRYFDLIMLKLSECIRGHKNEQQHPYYESFCNLRNEIRLMPQSLFTIDEISKKMNLSRSYVQHLYKVFFNTSIISDVQRFRIEHAKHLLAATDMTVACISRSCGYENDVHFMRTFKRETDMTPSEFRSYYKISLQEVKKSKSKNPFSI